MCRRAAGITERDSEMDQRIKPVVGLLPLYLKLYDELMPEVRNGFSGYLEGLAAELEARGVDVIGAPVCTDADDFKGATELFERCNAHCIVSLHLAYSPSLEAIDALCATDLPLVMLDTTMDAHFGQDVAAERIIYNHGIHGVMDLACLLRRRERPFEIVAGHISDPRVLDRVAGYARAAVAAALRGGRVLRVGPAFAGMGDFAVEENVLAAKIGVSVRDADLNSLDEAVLKIPDEAVAREVALDRERYLCELPAEAHERSVRVGLGLRHLLEEGGCFAFSVNFQEFSRSDRPANTMPFLEISKAMGRGVGYAGEGDALTAALVGALGRAYDAVSFVEIFCADWAGERLFLSHMGEISTSIAEGKPRVIAKPFFMGGSLDPAILTCSARPGPAVLVNLAPGPNNTFRLLLAPVEVLAEDGSLTSEMRDTVRIWVRPQGRVAPFLEAYSRAGGTHHSALVLGAEAESVGAFGRMCGWEVERF
jgi:L-arabinose isomerase